MTPKAGDDKPAATERAAKGKSKAAKAESSKKATKTTKAKATKKATTKATKTKAAKKTATKATKKTTARKPKASAEDAGTSRLRVRQVKSTVRGLRTFKRTLEALGIRHHQDETVVRDTPATRGMLRKVRHLVRVTPEE